MRTLHTLCGIALALVLQASVASAQQFRAAPKVIYGGFVSPRTVPSDATVRTAAPPDALPYDGHGPLDRHRTYLWDNRAHRWDGSAWIVIGSEDSPPTAASPAENAAPAPAPDATLAPSPASPRVTPPAISPENSPATTAQDDSNLAAEVQRALAKRGYDPGPVDGQFGPQTRNAIISFQNDRGARGTGVIDSALLDSLSACGSPIQLIQQTDVRPIGGGF